VLAMERVAKVAQHVGGGSSFVDELASLAALKRDGMLTDAEFGLAKAKLLRADPLPRPPVAVSRGGAAAAAAEAEGPVQMGERDRFLYDLQGFLHVPGHLTQEEVFQLNRAFDENWDKRHLGVGGRQNEFTGMLEWPQPYCQPFRDLLAHPKSLPYLNTQFGQGWRTYSAQPLPSSLSLSLLCRPSFQSPNRKTWHFRSWERRHGSLSLYDHRHCRP
jgi:hypothetical protein